jgi:hypothetical protein
MKHEIYFFVWLAYHDSLAFCDYQTQHILYPAS